MEVIPHLEEEISKALNTCANYEEWATKFFELLQVLPPSLQICQMILSRFIDGFIHRDYYTNFAAWLGLVNKDYQLLFEEMFKNIYEVNSPVDPNLPQIYEEAKFFAILFQRDSISWNILSCVQLKENSASTQEFFITLLLLELSSQMGTKQLCERLRELKMNNQVQGLFPDDKLENILHAIKIFELVDLNELTYDLYKCLDSLQNRELTDQIQKMSL